MMSFFAINRSVMPVEAFPELAGRERKILSPIARDESNAEIARALTVNVKTVRNHASKILGKLQVADTPLTLRLRWAEQLASSVPALVLGMPAQGSRGQ
jgi:DNA-binding NarL/FixJ family response regulator